MEVITEKLSNGNIIEYKIINGTTYHKETSEEVINVLEQSRMNKKRIILDYGDTKTGRSWNEIYDITGYIGRSTGKIKIPLLIYNSRSIGGSSILDHCIIGIYTSKGKNPLYKIKIK